MTLTFVSARFLVSLRTTGCLLNIFLFTTKYERIINTLFLWIYHTCHANVLQMWKIHASSSQKWRNRTYLSHLWKFARILHRCDKYIRIFHTFDRFFLLSHSNESVTHVKNSHVFVTSVKNSNEFFTGMTNTCEFFTRLKLDICEKLVPIKISKLVVRKFHTYQNVMYSCE